MKEATARIKIGKLLEAMRCAIFADSNGPVGIHIEPWVTIERPISKFLENASRSQEKASGG